MRKVLLAVVLLLFAGAAHAQTQSIFLAATAQGAGTGADCADAKAFTFFNSSTWQATFTSGSISPGTSVIICGTITITPPTAKITSVVGSGTCTPTGFCGTYTITANNSFTAGESVDIYNLTNAFFLNDDGGPAFFAPTNPLPIVGTPTSTSFVVACPHGSGSVTCTQPYGPTAETSGAAGVVSLTAPFTFQGNGTSGSPIILKFDAATSGTLTAPFWGANGAINTNGKNFIIIDGNNLAGTIQATANGTPGTFANQVTNSTAIVHLNSSNSTVKNLNILNIYQHSCTTVRSSCNDEYGGNTNGINSSPTIAVSNITLSGNNINGVRWGAQMGVASGSTVSGYVFSNNFETNIDHMLFSANGVNGINDQMVISGNICTMTANWDEAADQFHHDCVHVSANDSSGAQINGARIYNNYFNGIPGDSTAWLFLAGETGGSGTALGIVGTYVFNNVFVVSGAGPNPGNPADSMLDSIAASGFIFNNTFVGWSLSNVSENQGILIGDGGCVGNDTIYNNIHSTMGSGIGFDGSPLSCVAAPLALDYNDFYNSGGIGHSQTGACVTANPTTWLACTDFLPAGHDANSCLLTQYLGTASGCNPQLNASSTPPYQLTNSTSSAWATGKNLTSLVCGTVPAACFDAAGVARPTSGPWDIGAFESSATGAVTLTPSSYTFATTVVSQPSSDSPSIFTLANSSGSPITSISISFTGANAGDFSQTTSCGSSLANGSNCSINATFTPAAVGPRRATLNVAYAGSGSPQTSSLFGIAVPSVTNPSPANPVTFAVLVTDPSVPSTEKDEKYTEDLFTRNIDHLALVGLLH
ncbi:MAG TPA: choice-of-anchor D domain-containing protein [Candidatus Acidoferrales bacterium]|nr:choice-of-anchor D domain-containing protein [Candidatus Acidoferrales bacterium]